MNAIRLVEYVESFDQKGESGQVKVVSRRFGKRCRVLNLRENGGVLVQSGNFLPFPLAVKFRGLRAADKEELRASYGQVLRPL